MTQNEQKIEELCSKATADINLCRVAYAIIDNAPSEEKAKLLESFIIGFQYAPSDDSLELPCFMEEKEKIAMLMKYGRQVDQYMMELMDMELPENEFYERLWQYISSSPALPTIASRVVALFNCVADRKRLPYYAIDRSVALSMDQEEFEANLASIGEKALGRMEFILNAKFRQQTERASLILTMLDSFKTFEERTVFLTRVIAHFKAELHLMKSMEFARMLEVSRDLLPNDDLDDDVSDDDDEIIF